MVIVQTGFYQLPRRVKMVFDLVLCGEMAYMGERAIEAIKKNNMSDKVKILGYIDEQHKTTMYSEAKGLLFPTLYEGFGFPILEAMLCKTPVLTSNTGSAPELGRDFALYVDPHSIESIANGIDLLVEKQDFNLDAAADYASGFTWERHM